MLDIVKECFNNNVDENCYECLSSSEFEIYDCPTTNRCFTGRIGSVDSLTFKVSNPTAKPIYFFAVDRCLIPPHGQERCDCIVSDDNTVCFVEIKEPTGSTTMSRNKKKARSQLYSTIELFRLKVPLINSYVLEAYMCVSHTRTNPSVLASDINVRMKFKEINTTLYDGTTKVF